MPPILELAHASPLRYCRELIGTALALQRYVGKFFSNGGRPGGVLQTEPRSRRPPSNGCGNHSKRFTAGSRTRTGSPSWKAA